MIDYVLPRMNGLDLIRSLRVARIVEPAILITTHPSLWLREMAQGLGARILEKPLLGRMLAQAILEDLSASSWLCSLNERAAPPRLAHS